MDIHVTNKTNKSLEVVYVIKVMQLFSKHRISQIISSVLWRAVQKKCSVLGRKVIDACPTSNDV